ncbi:MAG: hypothetical protein DWQ07_25365 [Chloroflexi bacterium]|nr:MAG: hypothetical protein DWQ07_25365 [Chloroflexota bacterium]MBL1196134.1 hypothetical protein [Chloroflexota bacterium]NOH13427.1 hypothetical protein [Chloroflexota bacterium]
MALTFLPYNWPGNIYRSAMPFGAFDKEGDTFDAYGWYDIDTVVMLNSDAEALARSGRDLRSLYETKGFKVIHLPIEDFDVPTLESLEQTLDAIELEALQGRNVVIHCFAGIGRTGTTAALLARRNLGLGGQEAIDWIRNLVPGSVETKGQEDLIKEYHIEKKA